MDDMKSVCITGGRWRATAVALACATLLAALLAGCGSGKPVPATINTFAGVGKAIRSGMGLTEDGVVIDGRLITYKTGSLQGVLPSVQPVVVTRGNKDLKRVAITIDDGWNPDMRIMKLFKDDHVPFTAFVIGDRGIADAHPEFVKAMADAGGEVCGHTLSHYVMTGKSESFVMNELWQAQRIITNETHIVLPYVRYSGGANDKASLDWAGREGYWIINWTIDTRDSTANPQVDAQVNGTLAGLTNGAIILCHWGGHNTYDVLRRIIPEIRRRGYELTTLTGLFQGTPYLLKGTATSGGKKTVGQ
jgi:peptidoglycan/xylan/chitin deacetylase (PgdA/CDA1 family)